MACTRVRETTYARPYKMRGTNALKITDSSGKIIRYTFIIGYSSAHM